ncbi:MAG: DUF885 domain-containing protein [Clostridiales bacterium]|nr:DUF885 domain-containing protein [Clostridiales bacterium]
MKKIMMVVFVSMLVLVGCNTDAITEQNSGEAEETVQTQSRFKGATLQDFYDEMFVGLMNLEPESIEYIGDLAEYGLTAKTDTVTIKSHEYQTEVKSFYEDALIHLKTFDVESTDEAYMNYENVKWLIEIKLDQFKYGRNDFFLTSFAGELRSFYRFINEVHVIETEQDAKDWIARVVMSEVKIKDWIERYNSNVESGYFLDSISLDYAIKLVRDMTPRVIDLNELNSNFVTKVNALDLSEEKTSALKTSAIDAIENHFMPNMKDLKTALLDSREFTDSLEGLWDLPNYDEYYVHALKRQTTTSMSPDEIHQLGLSEVSRIQEEMKQAFAEIGYEGSLDSMLSSLYANSEYYSGQAAMDRYDEVSSEMESQLNLFFYEEDLPVSSANIVESPGGNYYLGPSLDGKRKGTYSLDLSYEHADFDINTLAYHEMVPGHHFEREHEMLLNDMPMIRKTANYTVYTEGWALYAETLANENGFNDTPERRIGYLKSELHRAARLVVDTGLHNKKWDYNQAVDYLVNEGLLGESYAKSEATRYISWPGQACSYKIGQLKLLELRTLMEEALGDAYDIKEFHHLVLENGSMPLEILEAYILEYIENNK